MQETHSPNELVEKVREKAWRILLAQVKEVITIRQQKNRMRGNDVRFE